MAPAVTLPLWPNTMTPVDVGSALANRKPCHVWSCTPSRKAIPTQLVVPPPEKVTPPIVSARTRTGLPAAGEPLVDPESASLPGARRRVRDDVRPVRHHDLGDAVVGELVQQGRDRRHPDRRASGGRRRRRLSDLVSAHEERIQGDRWMTCCPVGDDRDPVRAHDRPRWRTGHGSDRTLMRGIARRDQLAVDIDPGLATRRADRSDRCDRRTRELQACLGRAGIRRSRLAVHVSRAVRGSPGAAIADRAARLLDDRHPRHG